MIRVHIWRRKRKDARRALEDALAEADQENPGQLDRWDRPTVDWTPEALDRLDAWEDALIALDEARGKEAH